MVDDQATRCINDLKEKLDESEVVAGRMQFL
jgi:hypothetical protein